MTRIAGILLVTLLGSCSKQETVGRFFPLEEQALSVAASRCQNPAEMDWLRKIIKLAEEDIQYKGSIYAIQSSSGMVFLHQPWISSCFGCHIYNCNGDSLTLNESEKTEIFAGAKEENVIYTSSR
ncbi:MAG: hypothetical protein C0490_22870 [Marivirga sp.]|nr:hypothetical protein [Marivirga sp.]